MADAKINCQADDWTTGSWDRLGMAHFTAQATTNAAPEQVLRVLTDTEAIRDWSPIPFEVEDLDGVRLEAGSLARVSGCLAGKRVGFKVEVHAADPGGLKLTAEGPIAIDVLYELEPVDGGSEVFASVGVRDGSGVTGRLLAKATGALLKAGALDAAAGRIARAAELVPARARGLRGEAAEPVTYALAA